MRKLILIPEYRPLYAMAKCFGPTHGPLQKPCPTPVDVIGELLMQSGKEAVTIYETKMDSKGKAMTPVQLTKENYKLPYEEIVGLVEEPPEVLNDPAPEDEPVSATLVAVETPPVEEPAAEEEEVVEETETVTEENVSETEEVVEETHTTIEVEETVSETPVEEVSEEVATEEESEDESDESTVEENDSTPSGQDNPYAGMTKAERRRARKEAEAKAAAAEESTNA